MEPFLSFPYHSTVILCRRSLGSACTHEWNQLAVSPLLVRMPAGLLPLLRGPNAVLHCLAGVVACVPAPAPGHLGQLLRCSEAHVIDVPQGAGHMPAVRGHHVCCGACRTVHLQHQLYSFMTHLQTAIVRQGSTCTKRCAHKLKW
jgi:hypothetical protein